MTLRLLGALVVIGTAAIAGNVRAQIFLPPPPAIMVPPGDIADDDSDDVVETVPGIRSEPLPPPAGSTANAPIYSAPQGAPVYAAPSGAPFEPRQPDVAPAAPIELTAPAGLPPRGAPQTAIARPSPVDPSLRPPADVDDRPTASLKPAAIPQSNGLPPEYQPEMDQKKELPPNLRRQLVDYRTKEPTGTIIIDTSNTYLYFVLGEGKAMRYGIGVGREGFTWAGREKITRMAEWPDWFPPSEMIERQPYLPRFMAGGESNPLGARAMYLGKTLYRIHGTNQPSTIGTFVSSGCVRLTNDDVADLFQRAKVGTKVVVLAGNPPPSASAKPAPQAAAAAAPGLSAR
jgi:lipoprotein-anchoring transpeptidase ErfK/SrfK